MGATKLQKPWLVQKYGGTSLGKLLESICGSIIPSYLDEYNLVVVCSALSSSSKSSGTTSLLLECIALAEAGCGAQKKLTQTIDTIRDIHLAVLDLHQTKGDSEGLFASTKSLIQDECESLCKFLLAAQIVGELSPRTRDRIVALGEKLACIIVAAVLSSKGTPAQAIVLQDIVESAFGSHLHQQKSALDSLGPRFYHVLADEIAIRLSKCNGKIPIVTGFFGSMPDSLLTTVGRGYSDLCAAMCAVGTGAAELQIWKEVDGIFTADPRKVPSARLLSTVTPEEATELTYYGSEVIHPLTMDQIRCANIPLRLQNVFNPTGAGTIIYPSRSSSPTPEDTDSSSGDETTFSNGTTSPAPGFMLGNGYHGEHQERRRPTAVTVKENITLLNVACNRNTKSQGFLPGVFTRLEDIRTDVDLVTTSERNVSLAFQVLGEAQDKHRRLRTELEKFGKVIITENMSIISVIGHKMRNMVGIASEILSSLAAAKVNIYLVSQGASEINVSLVVRAEDALLAINTIHAEVLKIPTAREQENNFIRGPWLY